MTQSAWQGPLIAFGAESSADNNAKRGPSVLDQSHMVMDPRALYQYNGGDSWRGWFGCGNFVTIDQIPGTVNATVLAAAQTGGPVAMVLATASAGAVNIGASVVNITTGVTATGLLILDSGGSALTYGTDASGSVWNPGGSVARNVTLTTGATSPATTFVVSGYDVYGTSMSESVLASASGSVSLGAKAFKYINAITPAASIAGCVAGVGSLCGLPLRADNVAYVSIRSDASNVTAIVAAVTAAASPTTGDVRGTFIMGTITATSRMIVFQNISAVNITSSAGMVGVVQG